MKKTKFLSDLLIIIISACLSAVGLYCFVNPAGFAPSGVDGIAVMTQKLFNINMGYISLAINIPLLVAAWFFINKKYVVYTTIFTVMSSVMIIVMENVNFPQYISENNMWTAVFASGIMFGARTALALRIGGSTGGVDIIACIIRQKKPYINVETIITVICYGVIGISFFVYGNIESIIMSVVQMLLFNITINYMLKSTRKAVEVKIITNKPEELKQDILTELKHGATTIDCQGMFTGDYKTMIVTIINIRQMDDLIKLSRKYPGSFIYFGEVNGVWGNFRWNKTDEVK